MSRHRWAVAAGLVVLAVIGCRVLFVAGCRRGTVPAHADARESAHNALSAALWSTARARVAAVRAQAILDKRGDFEHAKSQAAFWAGKSVETARNSARQQAAYAKADADATHNMGCLIGRRRMTGAEAWTAAQRAWDLALSAEAAADRAEEAARAAANPPAGWAIWIPGPPGPGQWKQIIAPDDIPPEHVKRIIPPSGG